MYQVPVGSPKLTTSFMRMPCMPCHSCMLDTIRSIDIIVDNQCIKSCKAESYKIASASGNLDAFTSVSWKYNSWTLWFMKNYFHRMGWPGESLFWHFTKASLYPCTWKLKFMTSMQLLDQLEDPSGCFLDSHVMNMAKDWSTVYQLAGFNQGWVLLRLQLLMK